jgi:hypothetical protein
MDIAKWHTFSHDSSPDPILSVLGNVGYANKAQEKYSCIGYIDLSWYLSGGNISICVIRHFSLIPSLKKSVNI